MGLLKVILVTIHFRVNLFFMFYFIMCYPAGKTMDTINRNSNGFNSYNRNSTGFNRNNNGLFGTLLVMHWVIFMGCFLVDGNHCITINPNGIRPKTHYRNFITVLMGNI